MGTFGHGSRKEALTDPLRMPRGGFLRSRKAMKRLRERGLANLRFVIAGGGPAPYMKKLKRLAADLGLDDIIWTGFVKDQAWLNCYGAADLFLFPSVTETQGLVVIESLAAGVPMVSVPLGNWTVCMRGWPAAGPEILVAVS